MQYPRYGNIVDLAQERGDENRRAHGGAAAKTAWDNLTETWALELAGFLVGLGSIAAIAIILRGYDGQRIPEWPLTINVVLSLIGNVGFAGTMFGIHSVVAQLKWIWFTKSPRPLADLAKFQNAGGPLGIIQLWLFTTGAQ